MVSLPVLGLVAVGFVTHPPVALAVFGTVAALVGLVGLGMAGVACVFAVLGRIERARPLTNRLAETSTRKSPAAEAETAE